MPIHVLLGTRVRELARQGKYLLAPILIVLVCIKGGAWAGYLLQKAGLIFPVSMGGMLMGVIIRNLHDLLGLKWIENEACDCAATWPLASRISHRSANRCAPDRRDEWLYADGLFDVAEITGPATARYLLAFAVASR